jgi:heme exporter protein D
MNLGPHASFIIASYAVSAVVVAALIAWVMLDYATLRRILGNLEERGVTRRSRRSAKSAPMSATSNAAGSAPRSVQ